MCWLQKHSQVINLTILLNTYFIFILIKNWEVNVMKFVEYVLSKEYKSEQRKRGWKIRQQRLNPDKKII